jgi:selenocysteine-specific elongation factor
VNPPPRSVFVLGTAGHVDHGKTTLVRSLTGIDTDRLPEERRRGISIELGFAWLDVGESTRVAIIDVPGHERFIRHMIGGAAGIDGVMLIIASDEGVMPQTREHLSICSLLGVDSGLVVLTRTDLVEPEFLALVEDDVASLVKATFLEGAPVLQFSAISDDPLPLDRLRHEIARLAQAKRPSGQSDRPFVMPIDRVFTIHGHGTVVTGTSLAGQVSVGDELVLSPGGHDVRIRSIESHGSPVQEAGPQRRLALNISPIGVDEVPRGARLVEPRAFSESLMWDATLSALPHLPFHLEDGEKALVYVGTSQLEVSIALLESTRLEPGATAAVQLRLATPAAILPGEHFVLRGFRDLGALGGTLGGGVIHGPSARRRKRPLLSFPWRSPPVDMLEQRLFEEGEVGLESRLLPGILPLSRADIAQSVRRGLSSRALAHAGQRLLAMRALSHLCDAIEATLRSYHEAFPARSGMRLDELRTRVRPDQHEATFLLAIAELEHSQRVHVSAAEARLSSHREASLRADLRLKIAETLQVAAMSPPSLDELASSFDVPRALFDEEVRALANEGTLTRVTKDILFHRDAIEALKAKVESFFETHESLDAQSLKELTGTSRKYAIPLGEWLDKARVTLRVGDVRKRRSIR